jgi:hypothetical protein
MQRCVKDPRIAPEHFLGPVAVVHVPIDDGDARDAVVQRVSGGDRDVVDETKAHRLIGTSVVPRRTQKRDAAIESLFEHPLHEIDTSPRSAAHRDDRARGEVRIGIELRPLADECVELLEIPGAMDLFELRRRCFARWNWRRAKACGSESRARGGQPFRALGMVIDASV